MKVRVKVPLSLPIQIDFHNTFAAKGKICYNRNMKACYKCKKKQSLDNFSRNRTRKDGHSAMCKVCSKEYFGQYKRKRKGVYKEYKRATRKRTRQFVFDYLKTHGCVDCGMENPVVLEFDHVRGEKRCNIAHMVRRNWSLELVQDEISKCEVRCSNCHKVRTAKVSGWYKDLT